MNNIPLFKNVIIESIFREYNRIKYLCSVFIQSKNWKGILILKSYVNIFYLTIKMINRIMIDAMIDKLY